MATVINLLPPKVEVRGLQGTTINTAITYKVDGVVKDFTGYIGSGELVTIPGGQTVAVPTVTLSALGVITVSLTASQTAGLNGNYLCRVFGTLGPTVTALVDFNYVILPV